MNRDDAPPSRGSRWVTRAKQWLQDRTDASALPGLGGKLVLDLDAPSLHGALTCGFADPALTGKAAAVLYPLSGVLSPLGGFDVSMDWSGQTVLDGHAEVSFGVVLGRVLRELARFCILHVHLRQVPKASATLPSS